MVLYSAIPLSGTQAPPTFDETVDAAARSWSGRADRPFVWCSRFRGGNGHKSELSSLLATPR